jgi:menaquinone-specific isochorismate synthase
VRHRHAGLLVTNAVINTCIDIAELADSIWQQWQQIQSLAYLSLPSVKRRPRSLKQQPVTSARRFKQSVQAALKRIEAQQLHKIVLAQALDVTAADEFAIAPSLHHLRQRYAGCYLFAMGNGRGQTFMGASPERLISIRCGELVTDALAGSAPRGKTAAQDLALANRLQLSEKERHEHRVVADFITQQLLEIGLQPLSATVPQLLRLSNIQHLHTPIRAKLPASVHPLDVLMALHPTPAVAGVPCQQACEAILEYEAFERSLYAAPLGWLDHRGNSEFIVGIRSALITANHARLYAGAGIVAGSDPARELAEIQLKLTALLNALV